MIDYKHIRQTFVMAEQVPTGIACMLSLCKYYGSWQESWLLERWGGMEKGEISLGGLKRALEGAGFCCRLLQMDLERLQRMSIPIILFFETDQGKKDFVICYGFDGNRYVVGDTSWGLMQYWPDEMEAMWIKGICMEVFPRENFERKEEQERQIMRYVWRYVRSEWEYPLILVICLTVIGGTVWGMSTLSECRFVMLGLLVVFCAEWYVLVTVCQQWKLHLCSRFNRFWGIMMERIGYIDTEKLCKVPELYPRLVLETEGIGLAILFGMGYLNRPWTWFVVGIYIPLSACVIGRYYQHMQSRFPEKSPSEPEFLEGIRRDKKMQVTAVSLLNALIAGWLCWPDWVSFVWVGMIAWLVTDIERLWMSIKPLFYTYWSIYQVYRKVEYK